MKKYIVTETRPAIQVWTYEVEAKSETEALEIILEGEISAFNYEVQAQDDEDESCFNIEEK